MTNLNGFWSEHRTEAIVFTTTPINDSFVQHLITPYRCGGNGLWFNMISIPYPHKYAVKTIDDDYYNFWESKTIDYLNKRDGLESFEILDRDGTELKPGEFNEDEY